MGRACGGTNERKRLGRHAIKATCGAALARYSRRLSAKYNKTLVFTEIGYCSGTSGYTARSHAVWRVTRTYTRVEEGSPSPRGYGHGHCLPRWWWWWWGGSCWLVVWTLPLHVLHGCRPVRSPPGTQGHRWRLRTAGYSLRGAVRGAAWRSVAARALSCCGGCFRAPVPRVPTMPSTTTAPTF